MKRLVLLLLLTAVSTSASAQSFFLGLSGVGIAVPGNYGYATGSLYGIQAGSYDLFGSGLGLRANAEAGIRELSGAYQGAIDFIYTSGGGSKLVLGGGLGAFAAPSIGVTNPYIELLVGGDFVIYYSPVSFFIEAQVRYYPSTQGFLYPAHLGFNFHF